MKQRKCPRCGNEMEKGQKKWCLKCAAETLPERQKAWARNQRNRINASIEGKEPKRRGNYGVVRLPGQEKKKKKTEGKTGKDNSMRAYILRIKEENMRRKAIGLPTLSYGKYVQLEHEGKL